MGEHKLGNLHTRDIVVLSSFFTLARKSAVTLLRFVSFLCGTEHPVKNHTKNYNRLENLRSVIYHFLAQFLSLDQ